MLRSHARSGPKASLNIIVRNTWTVKPENNYKWSKWSVNFERIPWITSSCTKGMHKFDSVQKKKSNLFFSFISETLVSWNTLFLATVWLAELYATFVPRLSWRLEGFAHGFIKPNGSQVAGLMFKTIAKKTDLGNFLRVTSVVQIW